MQRAYDSVDDIDLFIGMVMEQPAFNKAFVGATFLCIIGDQFARLKVSFRSNARKSVDALCRFSVFI